MKQSNNPVSRQKDLVVRELKGEVLIYDLKDNKAFCLNETSAIVWQLCDGNKSVAEIRQSMARKLKTPVTEDLVWLALDQLKQDNLLENSVQIETNPGGLSRREAIRRVGLASMIALPMISSLMAPTAAMANSHCTALQGVCTASDECCADAPNCNGGICCVGSGTLPAGSGTTSNGSTAAECQSNLESQCCSGRAAIGANFDAGGFFFCNGGCID